MARRERGWEGLVQVIARVRSLTPCPHTRSARESEDEDEEEEERRQSASRGCTLQYQHATLQVFTQFHTTSSEGTDQVVTMLGPDWLVEVTELVSDFMRVGDPRVARMVDNSTLAGLEPGTTHFKVGTRAVPGGLFTCGQRTQTFLGQDFQGLILWGHCQPGSRTHLLPHLPLCLKFHHQRSRPFSFTLGSPSKPHQPYQPCVAQRGLRADVDEEGEQWRLRQPGGQERALRI